MFFDLNIPVLVPVTAASKKGKEKQTSPAFSPAQLAGFEAKIDILVHCALPAYSCASFH
jgi:hypothetical protein